MLGEQSQVQGGIRGGVAGEIYSADEDGDFYRTRVRSLVMLVTH